MNEDNTPSSESEFHNRIAAELSDMEQVLKEISIQNELQPNDNIDFVAPRTSIERDLAAIWAEHLGLERVGIHDNFFDLGGHSLLATQILSRIHEHFQVELPLRTLFIDEFTVEEVSKLIEQSQLEQISPEDIASIVRELNELSDDEVRAFLKEYE